MRIIAALFFLLMLPLVGAIAQVKVLDSNHDQSSITYTLVHPLHTVESTSKEIVYRLECDPAKQEIKAVSARVDVMSFDSGNSNRDSHAMEVVDAVTYPDATFLSSNVAQSGDSVVVGGRLTFHGVTKDIIATVHPKWSSDKINFDGHFNISLTDFKIERPSLLMIPVHDTLRFVLKAAFDLK